MHIINSTQLTVGYTMGMDATGREFLIVVAKGTFRFPDEDGAPVYLHEEQLPLVMSDVFFGEPGRSAPKYEVDFALCKANCDVLLNATAHAPDGRPATRVAVGASVGNWSKSFTVVGNRRWEAGIGGIGPSPTEPFVQMPISYDRAFGGTDTYSPDPSDHAAFMRNPVGRGFHKSLKREWIDGSPLPNTEETGKPVRWMNGDYVPMSFGVIGRHWEPRAQFAGTYDQHWRSNVFPFLPSDFDARYYQTAPSDQQMPTPTGSQAVTLVNLTPDGRRTFVLPWFEAPVHVFPKKGRREDLTARLDTILIEPDAARVALTWRAARPLKRNMFEIDEVLVGTKPAGWWRARASGKSYYPSLAAFVQQRRGASD